MIVEKVEAKTQHALAKSPVFTFSCDAADTDLAIVCYYFNTSTMLPQCSLLQIAQPQEHDAQGFVQVRREGAGVVRICVVFWFVFNIYCFCFMIICFCRCLTSSHQNGKRSYGVSPLMVQQLMGFAGLCQHPVGQTLLLCFKLQLVAPGN